MERPVFKNIHVGEKVTLKRDDTMTGRVTTNIVIMGPTGAGKSSFIEALCGDTSLGISKNQLEGYTQDVSSYVLVNAMYRDSSAICIVDTPGFADRKISEMEIATKINKFLKKNLARANYILFLTPVTDIRLSGSRRRTIDTFKALAGVETARQITIVTTMWNQLYNDDATNQAHQRVKDLAINPAWKDLVDSKTVIQKFQNTQLSALQIIDAAVARDSPYMFELDHKSLTGKSRFFGNLVSDLDGRLQQLAFQEKNLTDDIAQAKSDKEPNPLLISLLEEKLEEVESDLGRFGRERVQLDGIKRRSEVESLLERLPRDFNKYIIDLGQQCKDHDWETNQPFQPLPPPPDFLLLLPPTPALAPAPSPAPQTAAGKEHPSHETSQTSLYRESVPHPDSILLISALEERAKGFQRDLDQLKQQLIGSPSATQRLNPGENSSSAHSSRRNWLDSMKDWRETKSKKGYHARG